MTKEYCCEDFKRAVNGYDNVFTWNDYEKNYTIDAYELVDEYILNYCPFCGVKL